MHSKTRKSHKTPEHFHKTPTYKKREDREQFFFEESNAKPGPDEGKILATAAAIAMIIIIAIAAGTMFLT